MLGRPLFALNRLESIGPCIFWGVGFHHRDHFSVPAIEIAFFTLVNVALSPKKESVGEVKTHSPHLTGMRVQQAVKQPHIHDQQNEGAYWKRRGFGPS